LKLPRDEDGFSLAKKLSKLDYAVSRQTGSHIRLTTFKNGEHRVTIPAHRNIKIGTLSSILKEVASHFKITREELLNKLLGD